ncbi:MAG: hypothetical protein Q7R35_15165 [Elusimicrobiota bacterium]|nr:hypothetical protein [Elusimicrobiota bacterium]
MIRELYNSVETAVDKHGGRVGNFTGDGFMLLFTSVENSIICLSRIIQDWEKTRGKYIEKYSASGVSVPDGRFLALRTGVSFGNFGTLAIKDTIHYSGSGINKAQRCEVASKDYFWQETIDTLTSPNYVFIDSSAENLIQVRSDFSVSAQLPAQFKGYFQAAASAEKPEFESRKQFIYAVWPREKAGSTGKSARELKKLAWAQTKSDIGDRLIIAALTARSGIKFHKLAESSAGKTRDILFKEAVTAYKDALRIYTSEPDSLDYALTQSNLGHAMGDHAELLVGEEKKKTLEEAVSAYKEALRILTFESSPGDYAMAQNNLGHAMEDQADLLSGVAKKQKLGEAVTAYREALRVQTFESLPDNYAMTQYNIGTALIGQAKLLTGEEKNKRLAEALTAYSEAMRVHTQTHYPNRYIKLADKVAELKSLIR